MGAGQKHRNAENVVNFNFKYKYNTVFTLLFAMNRPVVLFLIAYSCNLSRVQKNKLGAFVFHELLFKFHLRVLKRYLRILYVFC